MIVIAENRTLGLMLLKMSWTPQLLSSYLNISLERGQFRVVVSFKHKFELGV